MAKKDFENNRSAIQKSLEAALNWFCHSGIMDPPDGSWGVGERIAVTSGNSSMEEMRAAFPAITEHDGWAIVEQRRADCNFQLAWLFLLFSDLPESSEIYRKIGENLLDFLYFRSGLLKREGAINGYYFPKGSWQWSHITHFPKIYFDDESWCVFFQLEIARRFPQFNEKYHLLHWAMTLADELCAASEKALDSRFLDENGNWKAPEGWQGRFNLPHWGGLACMALARASLATEDEVRRQRYASVIEMYLAYAESHLDTFITSELSYLLLSCSAVRSYLATPRSISLSYTIAQRLSVQLSPSGNLPAQHNEAPIGKNLVDLIYTVNWAFMAFQTVRNDAPEFEQAYQRIKSLILNIQDAKPLPQFKGCWRGMFNLDSGTWGGGDCYEGGAGSIYSGWTNAPIATTLVLDLLNKNLFSL